METYPWDLILPSIYARPYPILNWPKVETLNFVPFNAQTSNWQRVWRIPGHPGHLNSTNMCHGSPCSTSKLNNAASTDHPPKDHLALSNQWHAGRRQSSVSYRQGQVVVHHGRQFRCRQSHTAYGDQNWAPGKAHSLWAPGRKLPANASQTCDNDVSLAIALTMTENQRPVDQCSPPPPYEDVLKLSLDQSEANQADDTDNELNLALALSMSAKQMPVNEHDDARVPCSVPEEILDPSVDALGPDDAVISRPTLLPTEIPDDSTGTIIWHDNSDGALQETPNDADPAPGASEENSPNEDSSTDSDERDYDCDNDIATSKQNATELEASTGQVDAVAAINGVPPEWQQAMHELDELGFDDLEENANALEAAGGDLKQAIKQLMIMSRKK